jgi:hypothetical protein
MSADAERAYHRLPRGRWRSAGKPLRSRLQIWESDAKNGIRATAFAAALFASACWSHAATVITFDDLTPGTVVTNQYAGVTFSSSPGNATTHAFGGGNIQAQTPFRAVVCRTPTSTSRLQ